MDGWKDGWTHQTTEQFSTWPQSILYEPDPENMIVFLDLVDMYFPLYLFIFFHGWLAFFVSAGCSVSFARVSVSKLSQSTVDLLHQDKIAAVLQK